MPCNLNLSIFLLSLNIIICYVISTSTDFTIGNLGAGAQSKHKNQKYDVTVHTCQSYNSEQYFNSNVCRHKF